MLFPPQLGIKSHTKICSCVAIWNFCAINEDRVLFNLVVCEVNMYRFGFFEFYSQFSFKDVYINFLLSCNVWTVAALTFWISFHDPMNAL
jgi:hypothetical protein